MNIRLSEREQSAIVESIAKLDPKASVYLYGSRTQLGLKGGDIDLLVLSDTLGFPDKVTLLVALKSRLGDQKIDLTIQNAQQLKTDAFTAKIVKTGIKLF